MQILKPRRTLLWEACRDELRLREERGDRRREPDHLGAAVVEHPVRGEGSVEADLAIEVRFGENTNIKNARHKKTRQEDNKNKMIGTIIQFMEQDGSAQQTVSIDQAPRIVIDAIRHGTPQFVRDVLAKGGIETIDVLKTELSDEKLPTGSGERVETIMFCDLECLSLIK